MEDCYRHSDRTVSRNIDRECFHDEEICHATGERRRDLISQIENIIGELDTSPCLKHIPEPEGRKPLIKYPGYIDRRPVHTVSTRPLITSVPVHEIRPTCDKILTSTSDYSKTFLQVCDDLPMKTPAWELERRKSQELRGGTVYKGCECIKRNGLQDQCPRTECGPKLECSSMNPGPCCEPALAVMGTLGECKETVEKISRQAHHSCHHICCCSC